MITQQDKTGKAPAAPWQVYIVRCRDGSYYTGITTDLARRIGQHNSHAGGARYTRPRQPVTLVYWEGAVNRSAASRREHQIKRMSPAMKRDLTRAAHPPDADFLRQEQAAAGLT